MWAKEGKDAKTLEGFYEELGEQRTKALQTVSLDVGGTYAKATRTKAQQALRDVYRAGQADAPERLDAWLAWACRSRIPAMVQLSQTIRAHPQGHP